MSIRIELQAADLGLESLASEALAAARPAAQAGAQLLYDQVKSNVGRLGRKTGNLAASIYQAYNEGQSGDGRATYSVSWNKKKAPHGFLVEFGYLQRYKVAQDSRGRLFPMVRPEMIGKPKPGRRASQSAKDAYYVPLEGGPRQVPGKAFLRSAASRLPQAQDAMRDRFFAELQAKGFIK